MRTETYQKLVNKIMSIDNPDEIIQIAKEHNRWILTQFVVSLEKVPLEKAIELIKYCEKNQRNFYFDAYLIALLEREDSTKENIELLLPELVAKNKADFKKLVEPANYSKTFKKFCEVIKVGKTRLGSGLTIYALGVTK